MKPLMPLIPLIMGHIVGLILLIQTKAAEGSLGDPKAFKGGDFVVGFAAFPKSLNYYLANEEFTDAVNRLVLEGLIEQDPDTFDAIPRLASSWTLSPDKKTYTFKINPKAVFSDGKPVTAHDVKFTWDSIYEAKHKTAPFQSLFSSFETVKVIDPQTVAFLVKTIHFQNLEKLADFLILPQHFYKEGDFNKAFNIRLSGSGPYIASQVLQDEKIVLKRNPHYWGASLKQNIGRYNFDKIIFKSIPDPNVNYEIFKKGDIDYYYFLSAKMWSTETNGPLYDKGYIQKLKGENQYPVATQGIAWNLRRPLFQDKSVRLALSHLLNRERLIKEIFFDNYRIATGIVSPDSPYQPQGIAPIAYDPKKARELLNATGWKVGTDGTLINNNQRFEFEMLIDGPMHQRYLTIYQEELKKMGIAMNIRVQDWAACLKLMDEWKFDSFLFARSRQVHPSNLMDEWGIVQADTKGSGNTTGYKNPLLDQTSLLIDQTFDYKKRLPLVQKIVKMIADDLPFTPTWEGKYFRVGYWNRYSFPEKGYFQYSRWRDAFHYWWYDDKKDALLKAAQAAGNGLK